jgi:FkbM family methyltransferase
MVRVRHAAFEPSRLRRLAILGAAGEGQRLAALCGEHGIEIAAIIDDDPNRVATSIGGYRVAPSSALETLDRDCPIVIASHRVLKAAERLKAKGFSAVAPFAVLQVLDSTAFPPHMFYDGWVDDTWRNRARYRALRDLFGDDMSRAVFDAVIGFRLTLDPFVLAPIVEWELYGPKSLLTYGTDEVYVDGGSFDGDSVRLFIDRVHGRFSRVVAFEPDKVTFARLKANFAGEPRVQPVNAGLHRNAATLRFNADASRGALISDTGESEIEVVALDDVLGDDRVSYIKMNIEGAEIDALHGAEKAIRRYGPKLAISAYHRPSDLWRIAETIQAIRPDYRLYLRQHDGGVIETVLYALAADSAENR